MDVFHINHCCAVYIVPYLYWNEERRRGKKGGASDYWLDVRKRDGGGGAFRYVLCATGGRGI